MSYDFETLGSIAAGVSVAAGTTAKWLWPIARDWLADRRERKQDEKTEREVVGGLRSLHAIYFAMERIESHGADRIVIFGGHNSGGVPRAGSPFYCSALHWHIAADYIDCIADYTEITVDSRYIAMLIHCERHGSYRFDPVAEEDGMLKRFYSAEGITDSVVFYLACHQNTFLYLSCCTHRGKFSDEQITSMKLHAGTIARAIKAKP